MTASMDWALSEITNIQTAARSGTPICTPRWPVLILRTRKRWRGPKSFHGEYVEESFHLLPVPLPSAKTSKEELTAGGLAEELQAGGVFSIRMERRWWRC
jgi:xylulose-5-phosphate/fructose-6-phosphate phosphoketolase